MRISHPFPAPAEKVLGALLKLQHTNGLTRDNDRGITPSVLPVTTSSFFRKLETVKPFVSRMLLLVTLLVAGGSARSYANDPGSIPRAMHLGSRTVSHHFPNRTGVPTAPHRSHARRAPRLGLSSFRHSRNVRTGPRSSFSGHDLKNPFSEIAQGFSIPSRVTTKRLLLDFRSGRGPPRMASHLKTPPRKVPPLPDLAFLTSSPADPEIAFPRHPSLLASSTASTPMRSRPGGPLCALFSRPSVGEST